MTSCIQARTWQQEWTSSLVSKAQVCHWKRSSLPLAASPQHREQVVWLMALTLVHIARLMLKEPGQPPCACRCRWDEQWQRHARMNRRRSNSQEHAGLRWAPEPASPMAGRAGRPGSRSPGRWARTRGGRIGRGLSQAAEALLGMGVELDGDEIMAVCPSEGHQIHTCPLHLHMPSLHMSANGMMIQG